MSLQQDEINRSSISRFLAALFRPFRIMSEPPPRLTNLHFHSPHGPSCMPVLEWHSQMADSSNYWDKNRDNHYMKCSLRRIEYYKCTPSAPSPSASCCMQRFNRNGDVEREFLVLYFSHWINGSSAEAVVSVDRDVYPQHTSSKQSSELIDTPSPKTCTYDTAYLLGSPRDLARNLIFAYGPYKKLCTLPFSLSSAPSALEVSTVLSVIHQQAPAHHLYEHESYWFADTAWRSLVKLFSGNEESCRNHSAFSRCRRITLGSSDQSVKAVCDAYQPEWQRMLEMVEQRHEAERAKLVARVQAEIEAENRERQHEIDQMREESRVRQHEIDQMRAEIEQLRLDVAASEGRTG
ncbi:hypothetical protein EV702DRAFT_1123831 [Suillus placidus]|uniref:Uncharacterized protein n=1 Tax=Suillus placidus TaxID=48579 RepID=A0A9P6ZPS5_9AGAM|nr:hypothetical protein EV702DRAFT_1123831 [Suillus placidus]